MSEKRFKVCIDSNNGVGLFDNSVKLLFIKFTNKEDAVSCKNSLKYHCNLMNELAEENEQLKLANAKWLDKSLKDKQIRYDNFTCKELTKKYLQLKEENEQLREILNELEEAIEKRGYDSIDEFW